jgi:hypothetical protein
LMRPVPFYSRVIPSPLDNPYVKHDTPSREDSTS